MNKPRVLRSGKRILSLKVPTPEKTVKDRGHTIYRIWDTSLDRVVYRHTALHLVVGFWHSLAASNRLFSGHQMQGYHVGEWDTLDTSLLVGPAQGQSYAIYRIWDTALVREVYRAVTREPVIQHWNMLAANNQLNAGHQFQGYDGLSQWHPLPDPELPTAERVPSYHLYRIWDRRSRQVVYQHPTMESVSAYWTNLEVQGLCESTYEIQGCDATGNQTRWDQI